MKKKIRLILTALALLLVVIIVVPRPSNFKLDNPMRQADGMPILIAHGGGNREFPDNTLEAFYNAYSVDKNVMMETDVSITKDGVVILSHDVTLDKKTNVTGKIADWNYSDLIAQKVDFGYTNPTTNGELSGERQHFKTDEGEERYPTDVTYPEGVSPRDEKVFLATSLEELIVAFPENRINVEIKQSGDLGLSALKNILGLLEKYNAFDRVVVASFHEELYDEFQRLRKANEVPDNFMYSPSYDATTTFTIETLLGLDLFFPDKLCVFQVPMKEMGVNLATRHFVKTAHRHNFAVHYWTVNEIEDMKKLIDIGADGIMTDYPHRLKEVMDSYNK